MARLRGKTGTYDQGIIASASAPGSGYVGQLWFNNSTGVLYQYMHDGTSNFWLDISSGGIGTSISEGVDFVGDIDPHSETNGTGLAVGSVYYNREKNRHFVCTVPTTDGNVWIGRYAASGGITTDYESGGTNYRVHTFLGSSRHALPSQAAGSTVDYFYLEDTTIDCAVMVCAGGGAGGSGNSNDGAGAGGAGGMLVATAKAFTAGKYKITVGCGGRGGGDYVNTDDGGDGANSIIYNAAWGTATANGGGGGGKNNTLGRAGGSGGGGGGGGSPKDGATGNQADSNGLTAHKGNGGNGVNATAYPGGGGGGAGGNGGNASASTGGTAGAGLANAFRTGSNVTYCAGGAGAPATDGLGAALNTPANTGNGGKAGGNNQLGGDGSNGIIVIRYAL